MRIIFPSHVELTYSCIHPVSPKSGKAFRVRTCVFECRTLIGYA